MENQSVMFLVTKYPYLSLPQLCYFQMGDGPKKARALWTGIEGHTMWGVNSSSDSGILRHFTSAHAQRHGSHDTDTRLACDRRPRRDRVSLFDPLAKVRPPVRLSHPRVVSSQGRT